MPFPRQVAVKAASRLIVYSRPGDTSLDVTKGDFLLTNLPKNTFILTISRTCVNHTERPSLHLGLSYIYNVLKIVLLLTFLVLP